MKELEYPFDSSFLLKKRRKLKKALLADGTPRMEKRIAVLGGSTTNDIVSMLERSRHNFYPYSIFLPLLFQRYKIHHLPC